MSPPDQIGTASAKLSDAEVARRALKLLAERKIIPTPHSFTEVCHEITGVKNAGVTPASLIKDVTRDLIRHGRMSAAEGLAMIDAAQAGHWLVVREGLDRALERKVGGAMTRWPHMTLTLLRQSDALHANWTRARKLDAVARVLEAAADQPDVALERLTRLIESWGGAMPPVPGAREAEGREGPLTQPAGPLTLPAAAAALGLPTPPPQRPSADARPVTERYGSDPALQAARDQAVAQAEAWKQVAQRAIQLLAQACGPHSAAAKKISTYLNEMPVRVDAQDSGAADRISARFVDLVVGIEQQLAEDHKVRLGLQRLLAMLCDNIKTLTPDEVWLAGQLEPIRALLLQPVGYNALEQAEARLAQVIAQQGRARQGLQEAKVALKEMLSTLIESIGLASNSTDTFATQIDGYRAQLEQAHDFDTLTRVVGGLLSDTASVRRSIEQSRGELQQAQRKVETYEARVQELERELSQVSTLVQKDPLTFALNRRGLDEAFRNESTRATRYSVPLALAVLDVDDFKRVNDSLGHAAGDRALVHLATLMQLTLRPTDFIARFGGEEFVLLLPVTDREGAVEAVERLSAELEQRPFQWKGQGHRITFSAGVCQWRPGEPLEACIARADAAMYEAKRSGKHRVVSAP